VIHQSLKRRNYKLYLLFVQQKLDLNLPDLWGRTPLFVLTLELLTNPCGKTRKMTRGLIYRTLKAGGDPSIPNEFGITPLHLLCELKSINWLAKMMIKYASMKDPINDNGITPLGLAYKNKYTKLIKYLEEGGADPNYEEADGMGKASSWAFENII
jgi:hypothetical protein